MTIHSSNAMIPALMPHAEASNLTQALRGDLGQTLASLKLTLQTLAGAHAHEDQEKFECAVSLVDALMKQIQELSLELRTPVVVGENHSSRGRAAQVSYETLTIRERQVLRLAAQGHTNRDIGSRLTISRRTAETHRANVMRKLRLKGPQDLIRFALRHGILSL
jgi:DNA-binding NarL/FixJ family response regulator